MVYICKDCSSIDYNKSYDSEFFDIEENAEEEIKKLFEKHGYEIKSVKIDKEYSDLECDSTQILHVNNLTRYAISSKILALRVEFFYNNNKSVGEVFGLIESKYHVDETFSRIEKYTNSNEYVDKYDNLELSLGIDEELAKELYILLQRLIKIDNSTSYISFHECEHVEALRFLENLELSCNTKLDKEEIEKIEEKIDEVKELSCACDIIENVRRDLDFIKGNIDEEKKKKTKRRNENMCTEKCDDGITCDRCAKYEEPERYWETTTKPIEDKKLADALKLLF